MSQGKWCYHRQEEEKEEEAAVGEEKSKQKDIVNLIHLFIPFCLPVDVCSSCAVCHLKWHLNSLLVDRGAFPYAFSQSSTFLLLPLSLGFYPFFFSFLFFRHCKTVFAVLLVTPVV